jgi:hypothetical protein
VVSIVGGSIHEGGAIANANVHDGNGVTNTGGQEVNPFGDNQKFGIPTLSSLHWSTASQVEILFNPSESDNHINVRDITLKFYNGNTQSMGSRISWDWRPTMATATADLYLTSIHLSGPI